MGSPEVIISRASVLQAEDQELSLIILVEASPFNGLPFSGQTGTTPKMHAFLYLDACSGPLVSGCLTG